MEVEVVVGRPREGSVTTRGEITAAARKRFSLEETMLAITQSQPGSPDNLMGPGFLTV